MARLEVQPAAPLTGQPVQLRVADAPPGATFEWDVSDGGRATRQTTQVAHIGVRFHAGGIHRAVVRVAAPSGIEFLAMSLDVHAPASPKARQDVRDRRGAAARAPSRRVHLASDPGVTIVDFRFSPTTTTIHAGDTLTWTNDGPSPHTATARDGSFDTGILQKGQSASHTFDQPGTFTYFCTVHPFMHATVVVLASATTPSPSPGPSSSQGSPGSPASGPQTSTPAPGPATLPLTGANVLNVIATGLLLTASGLLLRRLSRGKTQRDAPSNQSAEEPEPS